MRYTRANDLPDVGGRAMEGASAIDPSPVVGAWVSFDKATRGIVKLVVAADGPVLTVRAYGACEPSPCDWGEVGGAAFTGGVGLREAVGFKAFYDFGFMETTLAAYLNKRLLVVDSYNVFKDGSGRPRYFLRDHFYQ